MFKIKLDKINNFLKKSTKKSKLIFIKNYFTLILGSAIAKAISEIKLKILTITAIIKTGINIKIR